MSIPANRSWLTYKSLNLPAGQVIPVSVTGQLFTCKDATAAFKIAFGDRSEFFPMEAGLGFRLMEGDYFDRLTFRNDGSSDITVNYYAGRAEITDNRLGKLNSATYLTGHTAVAIAGGTTLTFTGINGTDLRKQIVVTNLASSGDLQILDASNNVAGTVPAGQAWTIECGGTIKVRNANVGAMGFNVGEIWYDLGQ
jgi:hypothetical protein